MYKYISPALEGKTGAELEAAVRENIRAYIKKRYPSYTSVIKGVGDVIGTQVPGAVIDAFGGFGGGIAGTGNTCGCLTGGLALLGLVLGEETGATQVFQEQMPALVHNHNLSANEKMEQFLQLFKKSIVYATLANRFEEKFGSLNCRDLSAPWQDNLVSRERFKNCHRIMEETAAMVMALLLEVEEKGITLGI